MLFGGGVGNSGYLATVDIFKSCNDNNDCDDGIFCNGIELCLNGWCQPTSTGDPCLNGTACNNTCNETAMNCFTESGISCANGDPCNSNDICNGNGSCSHIPNQICTEPDNISSSKKDNLLLVEILVPIFGGICILLI